MKCHVALSVLLAIPAFSQPMRGQSMRTVNDGVYTEAQARRGETIFGANCSGCHGDALQGKSDGPLRGTVFMDRWREDTLDVVFRHMRTLMPARAPGTLPEAAYLDVLALILEANGFPPGPQDLTAAATSSILLVGKNGPQPLPTNATVRTAGCLVANGSNWNLANAASLSRTRTGDRIDPAETQAAKTQSPGTGNFRLQNMDEFSPDSWKGHKVLVKGVLNRLSTGDRIHVLAITSVNADCAQ